MTTIQIPNSPEHSYKCIAVPGERLTKEVSDYTFLESEKQKFEIIERVCILKGEIMPVSLMLLATGKFIPAIDVWKNYQKSDRLYFFIVKKC